MPLAPDPSTVPVSLNGQIPGSWDPLVLPIDKPRGLTSFDVIRRLRRVSPIRKIGHAGTLDPLATGLLICLCGKATRLMNTYLEQPKTYTGTMRLGESTASYDSETEVVIRRDASHVLLEDLEKVRKTFIGEIRQTTPPYSAVKVGGERLYRKARRGEKVMLPERIVQIYRLDITEVTGQDVRFEVECSKGTYIRSLAHEMGEALSVGAHLIALRRTAIGSMNVDSAWKLDDFLAASQGKP